MMVSDVVWLEGTVFALFYGLTYLLFGFVVYVQDPGFIPRTSANTIHVLPFSSLSSLLPPLSNSDHFLTLNNDE